ncbi:hypothetical protein [Haladaptatus sp. NG-SE-30]
MSLRTAERQSPLLVAAVIVIGGWVILSALHVYNTMPPIWGGEAGVGQTVFSGLVGLLVLAVLFALIVGLTGALSESGPVPNRFPPER